MRIPSSLVDAISVWFVLTFSQKPMRLFGSIGLIIGGIGLLTHFGLAVLYAVQGAQIRPLFWTALVMELAALQIILIGCVAELVERVNSNLRTMGRMHAEQKAEILMGEVEISGNTAIEIPVLSGWNFQ
jgi:hypothetical protein